MKMQLKTLAAALTASAAMMATAVPAQAAGVPVFDVANINQMIVDYQIKSSRSAKWVISSRL